MGQAFGNMILTIIIGARTARKTFHQSRKLDHTVQIITEVIKWMISW